MGSGRNAFQAIKEWNQLYGETHNPDGSPKGVENPMKPPKDYQPMGVPPREVPTMDQDPSQVIDEMIKCNKGYILNKVNPKDSKTWVCIPDPNYKPEGDDPVAPTVTSGGVSSGGYQQELADILKRREKAADQDKWLALARTGLELMASKNPSFLGAVGEAGLPGLLIINRLVIHMITTRYLSLVKLMRLNGQMLHLQQNFPTLRLKELLIRLLIICVNTLKSLENQKKMKRDLKSHHQQRNRH
jgi:hypothetical protein